MNIKINFLFKQSFLWGEIKRQFQNDDITNHRLSEKVYKLSTNEQIVKINANKNSKQKFKV